MGLFGKIIGGALSLISGGSKKKAEKARRNAEAKAEERRLEEAQRQREFEMQKLMMTQNSSAKGGASINPMYIMGGVGLLAVVFFMTKKK